jgi:hypothetical protein
MQSGLRTGDRSGVRPHRLLSPMFERRAAIFTPRYAHHHRPYRVAAKPIGIFVPKLIRHACRKFGFTNIDILLHWAAIVGPELGRYTRPRCIRWPRNKDAILLADGTEASSRERTRLEVWVAPGKALNVEYGRAAIIDRVNAYFGYRAITELTVSVDQGLDATPARVRPTAAESHADAPSDAPDRLQVALKKLERSVQLKNACQTSLRTPP